jgi:phosphoenolpyruvate-protein phosphotransferase (PTS system enzyme I)
MMKTGHFQAIGVSSGIAIAKALVLTHESHHELPQARHDAIVEVELARLKGAAEITLSELQEIYARAKSEVGDENAKIFEAHRLILQDVEFIGAMETQIRRESVNAEAAVSAVADQFARLFEDMEDEYLRGRSADIRDVGMRLLSHLRKEPREKAALNEPVIVVAHDLSPSQTVGLDRRYVKGFLTATGSRTSHSAILARTMGVPAVVGLGEATLQIQHGALIVIDGVTGTVIVDPDAKEQEEFTEAECAFLQARKDLQAEIGGEAVTLDGCKVDVAANIATPDDLVGVQSSGADGIGLFRSEFLYMNRDSLPDEEEQFEAYRQVVESMKGRPVIIRTFDIGGDKSVPYLNLPKEMNPFLGYRAIRICLHRKTLFETQLRAMLRASYYGPVKIMFPMISTVSELRQAKEILRQVKDDLQAAHIPYDAAALEVGVMVETPACALIAHVIAKEVDFFSIGTNDLIQYTMACDRMNEQISYLYQPYSPAIIRLISIVIDAAHGAGIWVGMCGEMAGERMAVPLLLGLGLDEFSMSASSILDVRRLIRSISVEDARKLAEKALAAEDEDQVRNLVETFLANLPNTQYSQHVSEYTRATVE